MTHRPNVLLITVDTLRADHLGCYGYARDTSPRIDAVARQGALFERYFCAGIPTHPSYTTLYTGQHPITHGVVGHGGTARLDRATPVLPELFLYEGYTTCAVDTLMRDRLWFGRGYEYYIEPGLRHTLRLAVSADEINARAIPWIESHKDEPFFMFLHYWDPHAPYVPPERYRDLFYAGNPTDPANRSLDAWWEHPLGALARNTWLRVDEGAVTDPEYVVALYDQEVRHVNDAIGDLVSALDDAGLGEQTLVVILGDHGESMTEHGIFFEHHGLYDCTIRPPLIVRWPGQVAPGKRFPQMLQTHDVAPTLLDAAGIPVPSTMDGRSFWPLLSGQAAADPGREEIISVECSLQAKWSLRTGRYKFILAREPDFYGNPPRELYDLEADPGETRNLVGARPQLAASMEARLEDWIAERLRAQGLTEDPLKTQGLSLKAVMQAG
jgi:arylsulfatase A-like enzyme